MDNVCFILGCPRSGTTWVWGLIESHPKTIPFVAENNDGSLTEVTDFFSSESGIFIKKKLEAEEILKKFISHHKSRLVFEKTPIHTLKYENILNQFANAKIILVDRHPLGIANSLLNTELSAFKNATQLSIVGLIKTYFRHYQNILDKAKDRVHLVSYENLSNNTLEETVKIYNFLDISTKNIKKFVDENSKKTKIKVKGVLRKAEIDSYKTEMGIYQEIFTEKLEDEIKEYQRRRESNKGV